MIKFVMIAIGGATGAILRYTVAGWAQKLTESSFPAGTFTVNILGCLFIGILGALFAGPHLIREEYRFAILVGLLGAFTTFSTYAWETLSLVNDGQLTYAMGNILLSNVAGLIAVWIGYRLGQTLFGV